LKLPTRTIKLNPKGICVRLIPISCIHLGHKNCNIDYARSVIKYVIDTPDTYALMLGDTCENVLVDTMIKYRGSQHEQTISVEQQREEARCLLRPLSESKKILAWTESNHSLRSWYAAGFSVERTLAETLGVHFDGLEALLEIHVGRQTYYVHATHGVGSSTSIQSVTQKLEKQAARIISADVYIRGHHHHPVIHKTTRIDAKTGLIGKKLLVATGSFMEYPDSYGHRAEYNPTVLGCVKVKLYKNKWDIHASI